MFCRKGLSLIKLLVFVLVLALLGNGCLLANRGD